MSLAFLTLDLLFIHCFSENYVDGRILSTKYRVGMAPSYVTVHTLRDAQDHSLIKVNCYRIIKRKKKKKETKERRKIQEKKEKKKDV